MTEKTWTVGEIKTKLASDDSWLKRGLLAIYRNQTHDEILSKRTKHENGVGFNKIDSRFLTDLAEQLQATGNLSFRQIKAARKAMLKYGKQLARIANNKI